jgi:hypothetical protein
LPYSHPHAPGSTLQRHARKSVIPVTLRSDACKKAQKRDGRHILAAGHVTRSLQGERTPPDPPRRAVPKIRQRGSHWPRTGGVLFCAKGLVSNGLGAYRRLHDDRYRYCDAGAGFPLSGALTRQSRRLLRASKSRLKTLPSKSRCRNTPPCCKGRLPVMNGPGHKGWAAVTRLKVRAALAWECVQFE